jgi:hypothetical protein
MQEVMEGGKKNLRGDALKNLMKKQSVCIDMKL